MMEDYGATMFGSRVGFDRNDFLSPVQEEVVQFPRGTFSEEDIQRNDIAGILEFHTKERDRRISNNLPNVTLTSKSNGQNHHPTIQIPPILGKRKLPDEDANQTPNISVREPPMKKLKLGNSNETGRDLKRRAQRTIETDPKKGCYLYLKAGIEFLKDAYNLEVEGKTMQSCSYYRDNFTYFFKIIYFFKRYKFERYIALSYLGAALSGIKNFFLQLQTLSDEGRYLKTSFFNLNQQMSRSANQIEVDPKLRNRTMTYITDMNNMVRVFQSMEEADRRIPKKYHPSPLQKDMRSVKSDEVINYMTFLLDEFEKERS